MNYKDFQIKLVLGFRQDQYEIIDGSEAHKAYYLFLHPNERAIFSNGLAIIGKNIQDIKPAYNETMGWNPTHVLDDDDWNQIRNSGKEKIMRDILIEAKKVAQIAEKNKSLLNKTLSEANILMLKDGKKNVDDEGIKCEICNGYGYAVVEKDGKSCAVRCKCNPNEVE